MTYLPNLTRIAAASGAIAAAMAAAPANAYVYGVSTLDVEQLVVSITGASTSVNSFTFNLTNTASLNGPPVATGASCNSSGFNPCNTTSPVLDAAPAVAPGSNGLPAALNNMFPILTPNQVNSYSFADSVINNAALVQGVPTSIRQIAQSLLNVNGFAQANALIQSNTSLSTTLNTVGGAANLNLSFLADPDQRSQISGPTGTYLSQTDLNSSFTLTGNGGSVNFAPRGTASNDCSVMGALLGLGVTCLETADSQDLNFNTSTSTNPGTSDNSFETATVLTPFGINIFGLPAGTYTIAFNANTSTSIIRAVTPVSEPGTIGLMGAALAFAGACSIRRKSKQSA